MDCKVDLEDFGEAKLTSPRSLVAINDLCSQFGKAAKNRSLIARLCAALVGVCWAKENEKGFPVYNLSEGKIIEYGTECLDYLLKRGCSVEKLLFSTVPLFDELWDEMPKMKEVKAKEAFFRKEGNGGSSDSEDREALGA